MSDGPPRRLRDRARHGARIARTLAGAGLGRLVRRSEDDDRALGEALAGELDQLKGLAMKVGQILSYLDAPLPEAAQEALGRLQTGTAPLAYERIAAVIEASLGAPPERLFERFDRAPVAAASIGQVHRARFDGREVAVKVRYPGVEETFDADLRQLDRLAAVASLATAVDGRAIVAELHARLREECDYAREARWQEAFRRAFAADRTIVVPEVIGPRSSDRVLTSAWIEGAPLPSRFGGPRADRDRVGLVLARFAWTSFFAHGAIQADPHPGNQLVLEDGRVAFLDHGCVRAFPPAFVEAWRRVFRAVLDGDRAAFEAAVPETGMVGDERFDLDAHHALLRYLLEPYLTATTRVDRAYVARGAAHFGPRQPNARHTAIPPAWIWLARLQVGLHAVLARIEAEGPFRAVLEDALARPLVPLAP